MAKFDYFVILRRTLLITIFSVVMSLVVLISRAGLSLFLNPERKFQAMIIVLVAVCIGVLVYAYLALKVRLIDHLVGPKAEKYRAKLKIK